MRKEKGERVPPQTYVERAPCVGLKYYATALLKELGALVSNIKPSLGFQH